MDARSAEDGGEVTQLLNSVSLGHRDALDRLIPIVYDELRNLAERQLGREYAPRTLNATALVHEAYLKLAAGSINAEHRTHFLAIAAHAMRQVLVDRARRRRAIKRGGDQWQTTLGDRAQTVEMDSEDLLALDEALDQLEARQRQVVEMRYFGGLEEREIATVLRVTERTVRRDWVKARARLYRALHMQAPTGEPGTA